MSDHEQAAKRVEREADDMQRQSDALAENIGEARKDWAAKQSDDSVPGATGEPRDPDAEKPWPDE